MQSLRSLVVKTPQKYGTDQVNIFGSVKEPKKSLCPSVCLFGTKCSKALNLHLSLIGQS